MRYFRVGCYAVVLPLVLLTMVGCQGFSSSKQTTTPTTNTGPGQLTTSPGSLSFGTVQVGKNQSQGLTLINSGASSVTISQITATGTGFSASGLSLPLTLPAGQSKSVNVNFAPQSTGTKSGSITISNNGVTPSISVTLSGTGSSAPPPPQGTLTSNPTSLNFGSVQLTQNQQLYETLTNTGSATLTVSQATANGTGFSISGLTIPLVIASGHSFTFSAAFAPTTAGNASGTISLISNASDSSLDIPLTGTGTANSQLSVTPTSLNFGSVTVGSHSQLGASLLASGTNVTVSSVDLSSSEFTVSGLTFPITIPAGQSANFTVTFTPQSTGQASATASFNSNASNSPAVLSLSGDGGSATQHQVDLSWTASSSPNIAGYNVYRGTRHGGPYPTKVNTSLDPNTDFNDASVVSGQTYYYVSTAVNTGNVESGYSNEAKAVIPNP